MRGLSKDLTFPFGMIYSVEYTTPNDEEGGIMGSAATRAKRKWNREHYTNITVAMSPQLAARLKERCGKEGVSVTSVITGLVVGYLKDEAFPFAERG